MARVVERITVEWVEPEAAGGRTPTPGAGSGGGCDGRFRGWTRGTVRQHGGVTSWRVILVRRAGHGAGRGRTGGGATVPGSGRGGERIRRVEEPVGVGGVHDAGSPALSDSGPDRGADLQLVEFVHPAGHSEPAHGSNHESAPAAAWDRPTDDPR